MTDVADRPGTGTSGTATATATPNETPSKDKLEAISAPVGHGGGGGGGNRRVDKDLTKGNIPWTLFNLAWPQTISGMIQTVDQLADLIWAGFISPGAIASIGVAQSWSQVLMTFRMGLDVSTRAMVSRAVGAKDMELARHVAMQSIIFGLGVMIVMVTFAVIFTEFLLGSLGISQELI